MNTVRPGPYLNHLVAFHSPENPNRHAHFGLWPEASPIRESSFHEAQHALVARILRTAGLRNGEVILDLGCGIGGTLEVINSYHHGMQLTGLNLDPRQLAICRTLEPRHANTMNWIAADAVELPFRSNSMHQVLCIEAMFHFQSRRTLFREVHRVLRSGGSVTFSDIILNPGEEIAAIEAREDVPEQGGKPCTRGTTGTSATGTSATGTSATDNTPAMATTSAGHGLMNWIRGGFGSWPDPNLLEGSHKALALEAGLTEILIDEITQNTWPTHRHTLPPDLDRSTDPTDPILRASLALETLHRSGSLRYVIGRASKPGT